jgi:hypothetical protein
VVHNLKERGLGHLLIMMMLIKKHLHVQIPKKGLAHYLPNSQLICIIETNTNKGCRYIRITANANRLVNQEFLTICELMLKLPKSLEDKLAFKILMFMKYNYKLIFNEFFI